MNKIINSGNPLSDQEKPVVLADGKFIQLVRRKTWEYVTRKGVTGIVGLIPITDDRKIVLVEQFRPPLNARVIELPAGLAGDGKYHNETLESAARRELLEETGYEAAELKYVGGGTASAGITDELISLFLATGLRKTGPGEGDGDEDITVHEVPLDEVQAWLAIKAHDGVLIDLKVFSGLYFAGITAV
jgi:ADP-ribose pyrophosphatase